MRAREGERERKRGGGEKSAASERGEGLKKRNNSFRERGIEREKEAEERKGCMSRRRWLSV
jgi:hypothetical protein